jgi:hypothetical protein
MKKLVLLAALSFLAYNTFAATGPYLEANLGYSATGSSDIENNSLITKEASQTFGYNINGGFMFLGYGAELGYTRFGDLNYKQGGQEQSADLYGLHAALKTQYGFGPISVFAKLGLGQLSVGGVDKNANLSSSDLTKQGLYFGVGGSFAITPVMAVVAQYQQIQGKNDVPTANLASVGISFGF